MHCCMKCWNLENFCLLGALLSGMDLDLENFWSLLLCCLDWCFAVGGELCCRRGVLGLWYFVEIGLVLLGLGRFGSDG